MTAIETKNYLREILSPQRTIAQEFLVLDAIIDLIIQAITSAIPDWTNALTFQTDGTDDGRFTVYPDTNGKIRFWKTKVDDNINHQPPTNPVITEDAYWIEVSQADGSAIKEWTPGLYGNGLVIVYFDFSGDGSGWKLYLLNNPTRPFLSSNLATEIIAGDWKEFSGGYIGAGLLTSVDVSGGTITFNFNNGTHRSFKASATIGAAKTWAFTNTTNAMELKYFFAMTTPDIQTMPATVKMQSFIGDWNDATKEWTPPAIGDFEAALSYNGTNWLMKIYGPF